MPSIDGYVAQQFARPHGVGGRIVCAVMNRQNRPLYEATLAQLPPGDGRVLDVGCGNGYVMELLSTTHPGVLVGIDPSAEVIATATRRYRRMVDQDRLAFAIGKADATRQPDNFFDAAYSVNTIYFWEDLDAGFAEIERVLRPGGVFVNACYTAETLGEFSHTKHGYRKYDPSQLLQAATSSGFAAETVPVIGGRAFCVRCIKAPA